MADPRATSSLSSLIPRLQEALTVVFKRFSDSCDVVHCILEFYKEFAAAERRYSASIMKLLESASYNFHSNILMQWLGNDPFEEIGYINICLHNYYIALFMFDLLLFTVVVVNSAER